MPHRYLISTDLDGTLIDHHDYSFTAALPALQRCTELSVPVVLNTSKTLDEAMALQNQLSLQAPMIVENGSALFWGNCSTDNHNVQHDGQITINSSVMKYKLFGTPRNIILEFIAEVRTNYGWHFEGFNDWSISEISQHTGLSLNDAERANSKRFSEPFVWHDSDQSFDQMVKLAGRQGMHVLRGGRFYHLQGMTDKALPLNWLMQHPEILWAATELKRKPDCTLIALGDNHNDIAMLNAADIAICVRSPVAEYPVLSTPKTVVQTKGYGPTGWAEAVLSILND